MVYYMSCVLNTSGVEESVIYMDTIIYNMNSVFCCLTKWI